MKGIKSLGFFHPQNGVFVILPTLWSLPRTAFQIRCVDSDSKQQLPTFLVHTQFQCTQLTEACFYSRTVWCHQGKHSLQKMQGIIFIAIFQGDQSRYVQRARDDSWLPTQLPRKSPKLMLNHSTQPLAGAPWKLLWLQKQPSHFPEDGDGCSPREPWFTGKIWLLINILNPGMLLYSESKCAFLCG